jgi:hypothetical protein
VLDAREADVEYYEHRGADQASPNTLNTQTIGGSPTRNGTSKKKRTNIVGTLAA